MIGEGNWPVITATVPATLCFATVLRTRFTRPATSSAMFSGKTFYWALARTSAIPLCCSPLFKHVIQNWAYQTEGWGLERDVQGCKCETGMARKSWELDDIWSWENSGNVIFIFFISLLDTEIIEDNNNTVIVLNSNFNSLFRKLRGSNSFERDRLPSKRSQPVLHPNRRVRKSQFPSFKLALDYFSLSSFALN